MTAQILELSVRPSEPEEVAGEYELRPDLSPEAVLKDLPGEADSSAAPTLTALLAALREDQELTGIRRLRLRRGLAGAARLEAGPGPGLTAAVAPGALRAGALWAAWLAELLQAQALYPGPQDTRLPRRFAPLAGVVAPLRHLLEKIRVQARRQPELLSQALAPLGREGDLPLDPLGHTRQLLSTFLSREDWRERDVFHLIMDFVQNSPGLYGEPLLNTWFSLKRLQDEDSPAYTRILAALINEGRGYLAELPRGRRRLRERGAGVGATLTAAALRQVGQAVAGLLGLGPGDLPAPEDLDWPGLQEAARKQGWPASGALKPLEKASLFLAAELFPDQSSHRRFCRYLLENEEPYRRLLAAAYGPAADQEAELRRLMDGFNRHPANVETQVEFTPAEAARFLRLFFLRPDPVETIIDREWKKDLYHTLKGLKGRALLPQVLHECQNIFRYITPEVLAKVAAGLEVPPPEIIRVIASYKEFTADPAGQIVLYVCKGTACFLRGQPPSPGPWLNIWVRRRGGSLPRASSSWNGTASEPATWRRSSRWASPSSPWSGRRRFRRLLSGF